MVHQGQGGHAPDSGFLPGTLQHLVVGNEGRMLDARRTPFRVVDVRPERGEFELEILAFEDVGTRWAIPVFEIRGYQFAQSGGMLHNTVDLAEAAERLDRPLHIPAPGRLIDLTSRRLRARDVLGDLKPDLAGHRGSEPVAEALQTMLADHDLVQMEEAFTSRFVSNPGAGELVKGHRIVLAELGLVPFEGRLVRDPQLFDGAWSRERRAEHILQRLAFVHELFAEYKTVWLWRGIGTAGPLKPRSNRSFVSATFHRDVAESFAGFAQDRPLSMLMRAAVPVHRLFMTYIETRAMNAQYLEAEAILMHETSRAF
jgi:hypothetical protein